MVVKSDGSKWACQSCLKGHRVSGCTHVDRELFHVPKKGRPVTQCQHCRQERKKRSAHVSCECAGVEKPHHSKEKCIHLREAEERAKAGYCDELTGENHAAHLALVAEEQGCCCPHGGKCTCSLLKREVNSDGASPTHGPAVKPRLESAKSEGSITVFQNGHHKPVHRKNHLAHEAGMPYKIPMPRAHTDHTVSAKARRSVDSLALDNNMPICPSAFTPQTSAPFNTERRMSKSEQPSPKMDPFPGGCPIMGDKKLLDMDFSTLGPVDTNQSLASTTSEALNYNANELPSAVQDYMFDPWSSLPSAESLNMPNNNPFGVWPTDSQASNMAQPALTAASSGTQSEIDEMPPMDDMLGFGMPSIQEDTGSFDIDALAASGSPLSNRHSLPQNFFKDITTDAEWPISLDANISTGQKSFDAAQLMDFDEVWRMGDLPMVSDNIARTASGLPLCSRPSSRSVGADFAPKPTNDVLQQLFPDMDLNGGYFNTPSSSQDFAVATSNATASAAPTSLASMDFGPMDESIGFTSQAWSDGSMSIPNDDFANPYDVLDQDFTDPDLGSNWAQ
ncbi:hypothetical protein BAUCODRAFT_144905 [Baudoinia panamericana UAMH 10762]|uniref:Copper-fist domain-containing protein n=1 Tax=Baudoinia panamericana (strain UAMH 10762) TaxID=717646 RepID=M2LXU4_BAUPA|nr:uncharacterized protein BAUCODRAFT_144905 [Baudoinia panamericana UAMH 10762]EMC99492.1 hypothetical protein BAUCODRAFT_144905 [Baudoinia panamericana UAMH 10762]